MGFGTYLVIFCLTRISIADNDTMVTTRDPNEPDVRLPPSITEQGPELKIYRLSTEYDLPCRATGYPKPQYEWMKNGRLLEDFSMGNVRLSDEDGTLHFNPITSLDEGDYQCFAYNDYGRALTRITSLRRAVLAGYPPTTPQLYKGVEGEGLIVPCQQTKSVPAATFEWGLANGESDENPQTLQLSRRLTIDENGNLYFAHLTLNDEREGFLYKCVAFNPDLFYSTGGSDSKVTVEESNAGDRPPELMVSSPSPTIMLLNSDSHLKCFFKGKPTPRISWKRVNMALPAGRTQKKEYDTELHFETVQWEDEGEYECTGSNGVGSAAIQRIFIDVQSKPEFIEGKHPRDQNATEGSTIVFYCDARAEPEASIQWLINGEPIDARMPGHRRQISEDGTSLSVTDVCKDCGSGNTDLMVVQCNVSNTHGYAFAAGYLNVLIPTVIYLGPTSQEYDPNEDQIIFQCEASTDDSTALIIRWYHNDAHIYVDQEDRITLTPENSLIINVRDMDRDEVNRKFSGEYRCEASNGFSTDEAIAELRVGSGGGAVITTAGGFDMWWLAVIAAIILLLIILLLCCCMCLQRNKGDSYPVDEKERADGHDPEKELADSGFHDYHRPEDNEPVKGSRASLTSTIKLDSDDEGSLAEYGDIDPMKFNEDGSFIGQYATDKKKKRAHDTDV